MTDSSHRPSDSVVQVGKITEYPNWSIFTVTYITTGSFAGSLSTNFPDVKKAQQRFLAICILNFEP